MRALGAVASLKDLRGRINSVRNTRKITSAMKMVSASKLRRAQSQAEAARPYAERMERMLAALANSARNSPTAPRLLAGTGQDQRQLLIVVTADRGLAGAFNSNVGRAARTLIRRLEGEGKQVRIITVGRKGRDYLRREFADRLVGEVSFAGRKSVSFADVAGIAEQATAMVQNGEADVVKVLYNRFVSVVSQIPTETQLVPLPMPDTAEEPAGGWGARDLRVRAGRGDDPGRAAAAQPRDPALPRRHRERRRRAGRAHGGHGQRDPQRGRDDHPPDAQLQPHAPGQHHQGTDRDHLRRRSRLIETLPSGP